MSDKRDIVFVSTIHRMSERLLPVFEALSSDFNIHSVRMGQASHVLIKTCLGKRTGIGLET